MALPPLFVKSGTVGENDGVVHQVQKLWVKDGPPGDTNGTVREVVTLRGKGSVDEVDPQPQPLSAAAVPGIYSSESVGSDNISIDVIQRVPPMANDYLQVGDAQHRRTINWGSYRNIRTTQAARMQRGTDVLMSMSFKNYYGDGFDASNVGLRAIGQTVLGTPHPDYNDMMTIWDYLCDRAEELALDYPERKIWLGLPEGEADAKINKYQLLLTNPDQAGDKVACTPQEAGAAWNFLLSRSKQRAPHVRFGLWFAGTQTGIISQIMSYIQTRPDIIIADPYTNGTRIETLTTCFLDWLNWLRGSQQYSRLSALGDGSPIPCGIGEYGMETPAHTDAQVATYLTNAHQVLVTLGLEFAIWFNSDRDRGHVITDGNYPQGVIQMRDMFDDHYATL